MSYSDPEEYNILSQKGRSPNYAKQKRQIKKHTRKSFYVTKTLYDPMDTISKKSRRTVITEKDGFCLDVPYSMNKKERWEKVDAATLLKIRQKLPPETLETLVVNREDVPPPDGEHGNTVKSIELVHNDGIITLASGGRSNSLSHFNSRLRDLKHMNKKEPDPARLLYNFSTSEQTAAKRKKRNCKQRKQRAYQNSFDTDYEDCDTLRTFECEPYTSEEEFTVNERDFSFSDKNVKEYSESSVGSFSDLGLDEYLTEPKQECSGVSTSPSNAKINQKGSSIKTSAAASDVPNTDKIIFASDVPNTDKIIFEVIETPLGSFETFSIERNILPFIRKELYKKWLEPNRLFISSLEVSHPKFVLFFEEDKSRNVLRVRISTDSSYTKVASRSRLMDIVRTKKGNDISALFSDLYDFVNETTTGWIKDYCDNYDWNCRIKKYPESLRYRVNSKLIAAMAASSFEFDQMNQLKRLYEQGCPEMHSSGIYTESEFTSKCCCCRKVGKSDCFWFSRGMTCRECASISITDQLEHKKFPIEIPKVSPSSALHFEVLYAVLPIPTVASLLKESLAFQAKPRFEMRFIKCPKCAMPYDCPMPLATTEDCVFNSCMCTKCLTAFCYLCEWEPHWPMSCEQFKKWTSRWDTQYVYENHHIDGEQLRLCCACEEFYSVPKGAKDKSCPRLVCELYWRPPARAHDHSHDSTYNWNDNANLYRHLKALNIDIKKCDICGHDILPESVELKPVMNRKVAELCAYARRQRFLRNSDFEKYVASTFNTKKKEKFKDLRKTVLYLIEFCTGWIYVAKPFDWKHLSLQIANLSNSLQLIEQGIPSARDDFIKQMGELEEETQNLVELVRKCLSRE